MTREPIPQVAPGRLVQARRCEVDGAIGRVLDSGVFIQGDEGRAFEQEFAAAMDAREAIAVASGTDAIEIGLRALGIGPGDGVLTVAHTAGATVTAICRAGATPVLVDVDARTFTMDPAAAQIAINTQWDVPIRAMVPVHLYGLMADMPSLMALADAHNIVVVEDCAQAHGATVAGRPAGTWGAAGAFSFYPTKNLAALGDGGALITSDPAVAEKARQLREYGWQPKQVAIREGQNSRLDELQAAVLRLGLRYLAADNNRRVQIANAYDAGLPRTALVLPARPAGMAHVFHQYVVQVADRDALRAALDRAGIGTAIHYPVPVHMQPGLANRARVSESLEVTERIASQIVSLPMHPMLRDDEVARVIATIGSLGGGR